MFIRTDGTNMKYLLLNLSKCKGVQIKQLSTGQFSLMVDDIGLKTYSTHKEALNALDSLQEFIQSEDLFWDVRQT